jgi:hypothetical protein
MGPLRKDSGERAMSSQTLVTLVRPAYASYRCVCGRSKTVRRAFCRKCVAALPKSVRAGLARALVDGAADCYLECVAWLEAEGYVSRKAAVTLGLFSE